MTPSWSNQPVYSAMASLPGTSIGEKECYPETYPPVR